MPGSSLITPSRADPQTLVPAARTRYEHGWTRSQVLTEIYGVDLPPEAALFLRDFVNDHKPLQASWRIHPWELMIPLEDGGPSLEIGPIECAEEMQAYAQVPHVLLLGTTGYNDARYGGSLIGYDLDELRAGRSTVVGLNFVDRIPESGAQFALFGPSLVDVFADLIANYCKLIKHWIAKGVGGNSYADVDELNSHLASINALKRELAQVRSA